MKKLIKFKNRLYFKLKFNKVNLIIREFKKILFN
jgi:hypothetical protein